MRKTVLMLVASGGVRTIGALREFFENTYYWYLLLERNPGRLEKILAAADRALTWLADANFLEHEDENFIVTPLGQATAWSGLLPTTAKAFVALLEEHSRSFDERFGDLIGGLIHWICCSDEFRSETPSRFLPYPIGGASPGSAAFVAGGQLFSRLDRTDIRLCQSVHALILFIAGTEERVIFRRTHMSSGSVYRLAADVGWILDGLRMIAAVPDVSCPQTVGNSFGMLARRVRWGSPADTLDIIRIAQLARVPGFGRQRAVALGRHGVTSFEDLENLGAERVTEMVGSRTRAEALLEAVEQEIDISPNRYSLVHERLAARLGVDDVVKECAALMEKEYEDAIVRLLNSEDSWSVSVRDDGRRMNEPDILIRLDNIAVLLEIKDSTKEIRIDKEGSGFRCASEGNGLR